MMDIQELIKVESLPKIFYQLEEIGKVVDNALVGIEDMVCDEDNKKEVKKRKQEITAFKNMMEDRRKQIKTQVMAKYEEFNKKYEEEFKSKLVNIFKPPDSIKLLGIVSIEFSSFITAS